MRKACGVEVLLFEIAHCLWICSSFYSNFEKQNRKGSPTSLIYPYIGKVISFVIKQFFAFGKVHRAHCSIDMLGIGSALYKTPLKRRFGTWGVKQADSYEIPPAAVLLHPLRSFRKTSTCAEMTAIRNHIYYNPRGQPAGLVCSEMTVGAVFAAQRRIEPT